MSFTYVTHAQLSYCPHFQLTNWDPVCELVLPHFPDLGSIVSIQRDDVRGTVNVLQVAGTDILGEGDAQPQSSLLVCLPRQVADKVL